MKKLIKSFIVIGFQAVLLSSCVIKQPQEIVETPKTINVTGHGRVTIEPDLIYIKFLVRTMDWNVSKAVEKNAVNSNNAINAIISVGVPQEDISTSDYSITQDNSNNYPGQYTVRNTISVVIRNLDIAGAVIDAAVKQNTGANGVTSFKYGVSDQTTSLRQARTIAIQDAQDAASLLAGASGCKITGVQSINEYPSRTIQQANDYMLYKTSSAAEGSSTQIKEGTMIISSEVNITYTIEN